MINKSLQQEICQMVKNDQRLRKRFAKGNLSKKLAKSIAECDKKNTQRAKKIINKYGWPTFKLVGKKSSNDFWLIIQHADSDLKFQKRCLKLLEMTARKKQAHLKNFAYLTDRILVSEGKKQKFGTQYIIKKNKFIPKPIKEEKKVNKRRAMVGLGPIEEQTKKINKVYLKALSKIRS